MAVISPLSPDLINKIAAGEVIESPVSVVKELLDNSLDAGATKIEIALEEHGFKLIKVTDNGSGMSQEDLKFCCLPHYTSKLRSADDLNNIRTLGFRGEALSSICAVADVEIVSSVSDSKAGSKVIVSRGVVTDVNNVAGPKGTCVTVKNIFVNTPARKKFLKDEKKYYKELLRLINSYAVSHPQVLFTLIHNGRNIFHFIQRKNLEARLIDVFGKDYMGDFLPVDFSSATISLSGYVGKPKRASYNALSQYLYVNGRPVSSDIISNGVREAFGNLLEVRLYPDFILYLEISPNLVDVNVHPKKETVAFWDDKKIFEQIYEAVKAALGKASLEYVYKTDDDISGYVFHKLKDSVDRWLPGKGDEILQAGNVYLLKETSEGLLIVDQHAAHESILYEQYLGEYKSRRGGKEKFVFPEPVVFSLSPAKSEALKGDLEALQKMGFDVEEFGAKSFRVSAVPDLFKEHDVEELLEELISADDFGPAAGLLDKKTNRIIQYLACRGAVKAGDYLSPEERKELIEKLGKSMSYYACPHGRPTQVLLSYKELDKMFKRRK